MLHQNSANNPKRIVSWFDGFIAHFHAFPPIFGMKIRKFQQSSPWFPTQQKRGPILGKVLPLIRGIPLSTKVPLCRSLWAIPSMPFEPVTVQKFVRHVHHIHAKNKTDLKYQKWLCSWKKKERPGQQKHVKEKIIKTFAYFCRPHLILLVAPWKSLPLSSVAPEAPLVFWRKTNSPNSEWPGKSLKSWVLWPSESGSIWKENQNWIQNVQLSSLWCQIFESES